MSKLSTLVCAAVLIAGAGKALADDYKIYSPHVDEGELSVEANLNYSTDHRSARDNYFSQVYGLEYGVTNYWLTEFSGEIERNDDRIMKLTNYKWENVFAPFKPGENWVDIGFYAELEKISTAAGPNNIETKLLLEKEYDKFINTANIVLGHQFGSGSQTGFNAAFAWRTKYDLNEYFQPGIEYYADFGSLSDFEGYDKQGHIIGPVIEGKFDDIKYSTGVLFGVSPQSNDTTFKLNIEYEF